MNIDLIAVGLKTIGLFLLQHLTAILFLAGLVFIIYAVFLLSLIGGYAAIGIALILIALIVTNESQQQHEE